MGADARQRPLLGRLAALLEGLVQIGDADLLALLGSLLEDAEEDVVLLLGVRLAAVRLLGDDLLVHLAGLGEALDGVDHRGALAGLLPLGVVVLLQGVVDVGDRHGGLVGLRGLHLLDDDRLLLVGEAAAVAAGGQGALQGLQIALAHGILLVVELVLALVTSVLKTLFDQKTQLGPLVAPSLRTFIFIDDRYLFEFSRNPKRSLP